MSNLQKFFHRLSNVVVCGGITIGEGCVIGAGSVVTRDIPPYSLAVGNPCRVIRKITEKDHMPDGIAKLQTDR